MELKFFEGAAEMNFSEPPKSLPLIKPATPLWRVFLCFVQLNPRGVDLFLVSVNPPSSDKSDLKWAVTDENASMRARTEMDPHRSTLGGFWSVMFTAKLGFYGAFSYT
jgi:hypothetical protein